MRFGLTKRQLLLLLVVLVLGLATAALQLGGAPDLAIFLVSIGALAGLAWVVSFATEAVGQRFGPAVTGFLQSTLGNLPELFIVLFALSAGELVVARFSILGSLFANALLVLGVVSVVAAAFVSDWFVGSLDTAVHKLGISKAFTGLVIVAIAGNAVENVVGVTLAAKGQNDLAISVVKNSVTQIAAFLYPALVLVSLLFTTHLTFVLNPVYIGALFVMAIAVWQVTGDGEAVAFEGWALVGLFVVLATLTWFE